MRKNTKKIIGEIISGLIETAVEIFLDMLVG